MNDIVEEFMIIPMSPGEYCGGSTPGSIIAQQWFAQKKGKVIISFDRGCKYIDSVVKPHLGFFYDGDQREVTHRFAIVDITNRLGIEKYVDEFLPAWRRELYEATSGPEEHMTWMVISDICELKEHKPLEYFGIKRARSFVYTSRGSELECSEKVTSPEEFIDNIIYMSLVSSDKWTEDHLELIIWAWLVKNDTEYLQRQRIIEGHQLRLDLLTRTAKGDYMVFELKKDTATKETLYSQLRPYMNGTKRDLRIEKLQGILIARNPSSELKKELCKPKNKDIKFVPYTFCFKLGSDDKELL